MMSVMSEEESRAVDDKVNRGERDGTQRWVRRGVMILVGLVAAFILYKIAASFLPRWWANYIKGQVGDSITGGTVWGLFYGFAFTFLPVLLFFQARRKWVNWKAKIVVVLVALVLATPNWLTLWVVLGNTNASHAAERAFDVGGVGFRWASLIGAVVGGGLALAMVAGSIRMSYRRKQVKELKEQVKQSKAANDEAKGEDD